MSNWGDETHKKVDEAKLALDSVLSDGDRVVMVSMTGEKSSMTLRIINADPVMAQEMLRVALIHLAPIDEETMKRAH